VSLDAQVALAVEEVQLLLEVKVARTLTFAAAW
jgi:hypothetical protein